MLRALRFVILLVVAVVLLAVALANREAVVVRALAPDLAAYAGVGWTATLPLYLVIFGGIVAGLVLGFLWEWLRERKYRANARLRAREIVRLERELGDLRAMAAPAGDDVLAILDRPVATPVDPALPALPAATSAVARPAV